MSRRHGARCLSVMVPQARLALNLHKRSSIVTASIRSMSAITAQEDGRAVQKSTLSPSLDRTWNTARGIAFTFPRDTTWRPQHGLRFSSPSTTLPTSQMPPLKALTVQPLEDGTASLATARDISSTGINFRPSQKLGYPELSLPASSSECCIKDEPLYSLLDSPLTTHGVAYPDLDSPSQPPEGSDNPSPPTSGEEPFRTPLGFHIPKAKLETAMNSTSPSPTAYWQHTLYRGPSGDKETVKVHYCKNKENSETIAQLFLEEEVIGFDLEWKVNPKDDSIKKNVALVQVASEQRIALFHLARYPNAHLEDDFVTPSFRRLMESPDITKVGVNIKGDATRLRNFLHIKCQGLLELSHLYKLVKFSTGDVKKVNKTLVSLASQVQEHLQLPLWKGEVRSSDWTQELSYQQTQYAASDSYAGLLLFHVLESKRKTTDPIPPRPAHAELNLPIKLADGRAVPKVDEANETIEDYDEESDQCSDVSTEELERDVQTMTIKDSHTRLDFKDVSLRSTEPSVVLSDLPLEAEASAQKSVSLPPSSEVSIANAWVERYSESRALHRIATKAHATPAVLRAWNLWHEQGFEVPTIARLLRIPPLQHSTVANYIGKAILDEMLPYERERLYDLELHAGAFGPFSKRLKKIGRREGEREQ